MTSKHRSHSVLLVVAVMIVSIVLLQPRDLAQRGPARGGDAAMAAMRASSPDAFARALVARKLEFPRDHAAHDQFRTEWWYFTGHLVSADQRSFGFQLTLFRFELDDKNTHSPSAWRTPRIMLGHFALSDLDGAQFHAHERLTRALGEIAGATRDPITVWLDDWRIEYLDGGEHGRWRISAGQLETKLSLELEAESPIVTQGEAGLSRKSSAPGNASFYYSIPRLSAVGELELGGKAIAVNGSAWLDREWSTSALDPKHSGWDWFALQLDDGSSLMFYHLRRHDGSLDPHSAGSYLAPDGRVTTLAAEDVRITVKAHWTSPRSGTAYPSAWRLRVAPLGLDLEVHPRLAAQEWTQRFRYWEGVVAVRGEARGGAVGGRGYVEMTGY